MHSGANSLEAVLLTGGASRRMGSDKAALTVDGVPLAHRVASALSEVASPITVLGREPLEGFEFLADSEEFGGPIAALRNFRPSAPFIFVASCDLPLLRAEFVSGLLCDIGEAEAAVPLLEGRLQPTCALYARSAFEKLALSPPEMKSMMAWLDMLLFRRVDEVGLRQLGLDPNCARGCNTPEELAALLGR